LKKPIQFGKYYLLDRINVGGMAEVWRAKAFGVEGFERLLAVKRILPNIAEDEEFITMFIDEAKIAVQLNHANICQIFDLGKVDDSYFIALEFVHGKDLRAIFDRCKQKPVDGSTAMPLAQACFVVMKACEGLDYAHNKRDAQGREVGLVHRDVSPQNVLISYEGEVKLIDFGIAKAAGKASKTQQGILKGKFGYMSPEQVRGLPLDRRSDIFSLGIVLYELLTGERLFVGESDFSTLEKVRNVEILPPSTYNRRISDELERIVMKALAKDVDDRYQNAIDLHDDLQAFMYTAGEFYSRKDLAAWMKKVFVSEIEQESAKLEAFRQMPVPQLERPAPTPAPPPPPGGGRRPTMMGMGAVPGPTQAPPPPPRPSGQHAVVPPSRSPSGPQPVVPARPSAAHPVVASSPRPSAPHVAVSPSGQPVKPANGSARAGGRVDIEWDDEELATNIYDQPQDAADSVVDDKPDLSEIELSADGSPVPHASAGPAIPATPSMMVQPQASPAPAPAPAQRTATQQQHELAALPTAVGKPGRNGSQSRANPFDFVLPEQAPAFDSPPVTGPAARRAPPPSRTLLYGAAIGISAVLSLFALLVYQYFVGSRPGDVTILSDPATSVQVLLDNKRVLDGKGTPIDGTPAVVPLGPGSYVLTVQREGYVPYNEQVDIKAGEHRTVRAKLDPLASTGFNLVSDPPGAAAILDGQPLDQPTPLSVKSLPPGKHHIEVRGTAGQWAQDVTVEAGKVLDLRAVLGAPAAVAVAPAAVPAAVPAPKPVAPVVAAPAVVAKTPEPKPVPVEKEPAPKPVKVAAAEKPAPEPVKKVTHELPRPPKEEKPKPAPATAKKPAASTEEDDDDSTPAAPAKAKPVTPAPAKPAPPPAAKPAPAGGEGYLRVGSKPWTNITVDGKDTGLHTPQTKIKLTPGSHRVTLTNPQFNIKETFSVEIKAGETETVIKDLRPQNNDDSD
jgi:eukaryotic-like serine/threonine-protein kinase